MNRDKDIVRALGFVALYAAYVEEGVDIVMERLAQVCAKTDNKRKWPISRKINWCIRVIKSLRNNELDPLLNLLSKTKCVLEKRNEVIHGRIYAGNERSDYLKSGRQDIPERVVTADELYDLADELFELQATVPNVNMFATMRAIRAAHNQEHQPTSALLRLRCILTQTISTLARSCLRSNNWKNGRN